MFKSENICFKGPKYNQKEPSKSEAHMHITKPWVYLKYLSVKKAFHKYLLQALHEWFAKETSLKPEFICPWKFPEPYQEAKYTIDKYKIQTYIERYYKRIILHNHQIF
jgi:hypothetical protein